MPRPQCGLLAELIVRVTSVASTETEPQSAPMAAGHGISYATSEPGRKEVMQMTRPSINITPIERIGRVVMGVVAVFAGILLLRQADSAATAVLEALLVLAGVDLIVTGALGHCPLYRKLGHVPASLRRPA